MHPFTVSELGGRFDLQRALQWGTVPPLLGMEDVDARDTLKEEIQMEALVRNLGRFTRFLDYVAAYCGVVLNFRAIAKETRLSARTVQSYFEVLEDTLIVLQLPAWKQSPLKRLTSHPKFYLFDNGLTNTLAHRLDYQRVDFALYYWRTNNGAEVDFLIEEGGRFGLGAFRTRPSNERKIA